MDRRVKVCVLAEDPISAAGISSQLRMRSEVEVVADEEHSQSDVAVVVSDEVDGRSVRTIRALQRGGVTRVVMIVSRIDDVGLLTAVESGANALLRRSDAMPERVIGAVLAAAEGDGSVPPDLLGRLLDQMRHVQRDVLGPRGLSLSGFSDREVEVLRLLAEGNDTAEIAHELSYSERTVKNVIHDVTSRHRLKNRSHAVAFAVRQGLV
jgi:DNA-binding NarL/FixJ family response regulator